MKKELFFLTQAVIVSTCFCFNFNITNMSNCLDIPLNYKNDAEVEVKDIVYEPNANGFTDTLHGKFVVHAHRDHKETEMIVTFFKCPPGAVGVCNEQLSEKIEALGCQRFRTDKTGPWYMFAPAIDKRNICAEVMGEFDITGATIEGQYVEKYMKVEEGHYRIRMLHHLPGEAMDIKFLRGCVELDFDIYA